MNQAPTIRLVGGVLSAVSLISGGCAPRDAIANRVTTGAIVIDERVLVLSDVNLIDGTGTEIARDHTILIADGRIRAVGPVGTVQIPTDATVLDLSDRTVIPGIVGMHNHTHMPGVPFLGEAASRLYLASGVTTIQTTGSASPEDEIALADAIESGEAQGPRIFPTSPYFTGPGGSEAMIQPESAEDARDAVRRWAESGVNWIKLYRHVRPDIVRAVIDEAHDLGLRVTGHLCSLTFREAAAMGIDSLEHGLIAATDFVEGKKLGECPTGTVAAIEDLDLESVPVRGLIQYLIEEDVTLTSTLAILESHFSHRPQGDQRALTLLSPERVSAYEERQARLAESASESVFTETVFRKLLAFERAFVRAGGRLVAGPDTGRHVLPGLGDQRNFDLLREAGFESGEAIAIMTRNGAIALGIDDEVGTIEEGKRADLVLLRGEPETLRDIVLVFKDGKGYDPAQLLAGLEGEIGLSPLEPSSTDH